VNLACIVLIQITSDRQTHRRLDDGYEARSILLLRVKTMYKWFACLPNGIKLPGHSSLRLSLNQENYDFTGASDLTLYQ